MYSNVIAEKYPIQGIFWAEFIFFGAFRCFGFLKTPGSLDSDQNLLLLPIPHSIPWRPTIYFTLKFDVLLTNFY